MNELDDLSELIGATDERLSSADARITSVSTELANQLTELSRDIDELNRRSAESTAPPPTPTRPPRSTPPRSKHGSPNASTRPSTTCSTRPRSSRPNRPATRSSSGPTSPNSPNGSGAPAPGERQGWELRISTASAISWRAWSIFSWYSPRSPAASASSASTNSSSAWVNSSAGSSLAVEPGSAVPESPGVDSESGVRRFGRSGDLLAQVTSEAGEQLRQRLAQCGLQHRTIVVGHDHGAVLGDHVGRRRVLRHRHVVRPDVEQAVADGDHLLVTEGHLGPTLADVVERDPSRDRLGRLGVASHGQGTIGKTAVLILDHVGRQLAITPRVTRRRHVRLQLRALVVRRERHERPEHDEVLHRRLARRRRVEHRVVGREPTGVRLRRRTCSPPPCSWHRRPRHPPLQWWPATAGCSAPAPPTRRCRRVGRTMRRRCGTSSTRRSGSGTGPPGSEGAAGVPRASRSTA